MAVEPRSCGAPLALTMGETLALEETGAVDVVEVVE
jgi:hypothetical protein